MKLMRTMVMDGRFVRSVRKIEERSGIGSLAVFDK